VLISSPTVGRCELGELEMLKKQSLARKVTLTEMGSITRAGQLADLQGGGCGKQGHKAGTVVS